MRMICVMTAALALAWAGAADACCFLKCFCKSRPVAAPIFKFDLTIITVANQTPLHGKIPDPVDSQKDIVVIVHGPLPCDPNMRLIVPGLAPIAPQLYKPVRDFCEYTFVIPAKSLAPGKTFEIKVANGDGLAVSDSVTFDTK